MKALNIALLAVVALMAVGCAKEKKADSASTVTPYVAITPGVPYTPTITGPGQNPGSSYGGSAALTIVGADLYARNALMGQYTGRSMNNPTNIQVNLNLVKVEGSGFGGTVSVSYVDNGYSHIGYFTAGNSAASTKYNVWFSYGGRSVFHGFFEDYMGGLVVVIDDVVDLGDGKPVDKVSGSIWFKNFGLTYAPHSPTYCWYVYAGPYDCRAWKSGNAVNTYADVNPDNGYVKLGTFKDMSVSAAFNGASTL